MNDKPLLIGTPSVKREREEVCRSFAFHLNCEGHGGPRFESRDFFCSRKVECFSEDFEMVAEGLFESCEREVMNDVNKYLRKMQPIWAQRQERKLA